MKPELKLCTMQALHLIVLIFSIAATATGKHFLIETVDAPAPEEGGAVEDGAGVEGSVEDRAGEDFADNLLDNPVIRGESDKLTAAGKLETKEEGGTGAGLEVEQADEEKVKPGPTEAPKGITSPPMLSKLVKEEKDKKTNKTISVSIEGEEDQAPHVSCGRHYEPRCEDCPNNPNRPKSTQPRLWCNGDCFWKSGHCIRKTNETQVNCGGHYADTCQACPQGSRDWCNGDCKVKCKADTSCSSPGEWSCV